MFKNRKHQEVVEAVGIWLMLDTALAIVIFVLHSILYPTSDHTVALQFWLFFVVQSIIGGSIFYVAFYTPFGFHFRQAWRDLLGAPRRLVKYLWNYRR